MLLTVMDQLRTNTMARVVQIRVSPPKTAEPSARPLLLIASSAPPQDVMGFNSAALQFLQREIESKEEVTFFAEATGKLNERKKRRRKRERVVLTVV